MNQKFFLSFPKKEIIRLRFLTILYKKATIFWRIVSPLAAGVCAWFFGALVCAFSAFVFVFDFDAASELGFFPGVGGLEPPVVGWGLNKWCGFILWLILVMFQTGLRRVAFFFNIAFQSTFYHTFTNIRATTLIYWLDLANWGIPKVIIWDRDLSSCSISGQRYTQFWAPNYCTIRRIIHRLTVFRSKLIQTAEIVLRFYMHNMLKPEQWPEALPHLQIRMNNLKKLNKRRMQS